MLCNRGGNHWNSTPSPIPSAPPPPAEDVVPQARPAFARAEGPLPHILKFYLTNAQNTDMLSLRPWTRGVVSVSHYVEQSFFDGLNWKLPLRVRFPHVPIFKCRRRTNCENFDVDERHLWSFRAVFQLKCNFKKRAFESFSILKSWKNTFFGLFFKYNSKKSFSRCFSI